MAIGKISPTEACSRCAPELLSLETTDGITQPAGFAGQSRALEAVVFGIGIPHKGFNLFVNGPQGSGRHEMAETVVSEKAAPEPAPSDWCYVNNFSRSQVPKALEFPSGESVGFENELHDLVEVLKTNIPTVIEGDDFKEKIKTVNEELRQKTDQLIHEVEEKANVDSIALIKNEDSIAFAPMDGNRQPLDQAAFQHMPWETQRKVEGMIVNTRMHCKMR